MSLDPFANALVAGALLGGFYAAVTVGIIDGTRHELTKLSTEEIVDLRLYRGHTPLFDRA